MLYGRQIETASVYSRRMGITRDVQPLERFVEGANMGGCEIEAEDVFRWKIRWAPCAGMNNRLSKDGSHESLRRLPRLGSIIGCGSFHESETGLPD